MASVARVGIDINHSQIQDLVITLLFEGRPYKTLFAREANGEDFVTEIAVDVSPLPSIRGAWALNVANNAGTNYGTLDAWGIAFEE
jgi:subtilisin-like proprotein convertase family protein